MQLTTIHARFWAVTLSLALAAPAGSALAQEAAPPGGCNPAVAAVVGGVFGALLGKHDRTKGAAIGAGLASLACAAVNYESRQTASAQVARETFQRRTGTMPATVALADYAAAPGAPVIQRNAGQRQVIRTSGMVVIPDGASSAPEEEILIYPPGESAPLSPTRKPLNIAPDGGGFENTFSLPLDRQAPQGTYRYTVRLFVNGNVLGERAGSFQAI